MLMNKPLRMVSRLVETSPIGCFFLSVLPFLVCSLVALYAFMSELKVLNGYRNFMYNPSIHLHDTTRLWLQDRDALSHCSFLQPLQRTYCDSAQTAPFLSLVLVFQHRRQADLLTPDAIWAVKRVEDAVRAADPDSEWCYKTNSQCVPPDALSSLLFPSWHSDAPVPVFDGLGEEMQDLDATLLALRNSNQLGYFDTQFNATLASSYLKSTFHYGLPLPGYRHLRDRFSEQFGLLLDHIDQLQQDLLAEFGDLENISLGIDVEDVEMHNSFYNRKVTNYIVRLFGPLFLSMIAVTFGVLYLFTQSIAFPCVVIFQMILSVTPAFLLQSLVYSFEFNYLQFFTPYIAVVLSTFNSMYLYKMWNAIPRYDSSNKRLSTSDLVYSYLTGPGTFPIFFSVSSFAALMTVFLVADQTAVERLGFIFGFIVFENVYLEISFMPAFYVIQDQYLVKMCRSKRESLRISSRRKRIKEKWLRAFEYAKMVVKDKSKSRISSLNLDDMLLQDMRGPKSFQECFDAVFRQDDQSRSEGIPVHQFPINVKDVRQDFASKISASFDMFTDSILRWRYVILAATYLVIVSFLPKLLDLQPISAVPEEAPSIHISKISNLRRTMEQTCEWCAASADLSSEYAGSAHSLITSNANFAIRSEAVLSVPSPPTLRMKGSDSTSMYFQYEAPTIEGVSPILGYVLYLRNSSSSSNQWRRISIPSASTAFNVTGLVKYSHLEFALVAYNDIGEGFPSQLLNFSTSTENLVFEKSSKMGTFEDISMRSAVSIDVVFGMHSSGELDSDFNVLDERTQLELVRVGELFLNQTLIAQEFNFYKSRIMFLEVYKMSQEAGLPFPLSQSDLSSLLSSLLQSQRGYRFLNDVMFSRSGKIVGLRYHLVSSTNEMTTGGRVLNSKYEEWVQLFEDSTFSTSLDKSGIGTAFHTSEKWIQIVSDMAFVQSSVKVYFTMLIVSTFMSGLLLQSVLLSIVVFLSLLLSIITAYELRTGFGSPGFFIVDAITGPSFLIITFNVVLRMCHQFKLNNRLPILMRMKKVLNELLSTLFYGLCVMIACLSTMFMLPDVTHVRLFGILGLGAFFIIAFTTFVFLPAVLVAVGCEPATPVRVKSS